MARRVTTVLVVGLVLALGAAAIIFFQNRRPDLAASATVELSSIPEGVSARRIGVTPVFIVRQSSGFVVFLTDPQHLPGENVLWWCPSERLFASPTHGELFDVEGRAVGGPAARGLSRLETTVLDGALVINLDGRVESTSSSRPGAFSTPPQDGPWDVGPGVFLSRADPQR